MKIVIVDESCMQTHVTAADQDSDQTETLEITDAEWTEFNDVEEHYEQLLAGFKQRAAAERQATMGEIGQLRARLSQLEARLGVAPAPVAPKASKPHNPVDETDWGMGVGGRERPMNPTDFRNELADLRDRTTEKRARRGNG